MASDNEDDEEEAELGTLGIEAYHKTLTFTINFPFSDDTCFIAHFAPYTRNTREARKGYPSLALAFLARDLFLHTKRRAHARRRELAHINAHPALQTRIILR